MNKYENLKYIISNLTVLLIIAQFDDSFISNMSICFLVVIVVTFLTFLYYNNDNNPYIFLCTLLITSFFVLFQPIGHTFAFAAFFIILFDHITGNRNTKLTNKDTWINVLLAIIIVFNILGWLLKSKIETRYLTTAIITFFSFILVFNLARKIKWTENRLRLFYSIICIIMIYSLFTALLNSVNFFSTKSPLITTYETEYDEEGSIFIAMMGRTSTAFGAIFTAFIFPFVIGGNFKFIHTSRSLIRTGLISSLLLCIIGFSKSHTIVLLGGIVLALFLMAVFFSLKIKYVKSTVGVLLFFSIIIGITSNYINYSYLFKRFAEAPDIFQSIYKDPLRAESTSREDSFRLGLESLILCISQE